MEVLSLCRSVVESLIDSTTGHTLIVELAGMGAGPLDIVESYGVGMHLKQGVYLPDVLFKSAQLHAPLLGLLLCIESLCPNGR